ncbi:hypothetical protein [Methylocella sp.]|uniref:hypothetical protein n=1 Tax=Methylocella sp. TaxID=1978226 RepID=UPI0035AEFC2F
MEAIEMFSPRAVALAHLLIRSPELAVKGFTAIDVRRAAGDSAERMHLLDGDDAERACRELLEMRLISMDPGSSSSGSEKPSFYFKRDDLVAQFGY